MSLFFYLFTVAINLLLRSISDIGNSSLEMSLFFCQQSTWY